MSDSLSQLIRLRRWKLDEARRKAVELERLADRLRGEIAALEADLAREQAAVEKELELRRVFPGYAEQVRARRARLETSLRDVESELEQVREEVGAAFRELKKYEQAQRNRAELRQAALRRREQILGDEIGLSMFRRRQSGR